MAKYYTYGGKLLNNIANKALYSVPVVPGFWTFEAYNPGVGPLKVWSAAISADNAYRYVGTLEDGILVSDDYGQSWVDWSAVPFSGVSWVGITCDPTGQYVAAANKDTTDTYSPIWTSTDWGQNYTEQTSLLPYSNTTAICGNPLSVLYFTGATIGIYYSSNGGVSWSTPTSPPAQPNGTCLASSDSGQYAIYGTAYDYLYTTSDYGDTWSVTSSPQSYWTGVASDSTGQYLAATETDIAGDVWISDDYGSNWSALGIGYYSWTDVASSSDGNVLIITSQNGGQWASRDRGLNWTYLSAGSKRCAAVTADGNNVVIGSDVIGNTVVSRAYWTPPVG